MRMNERMIGINNIFKQYTSPPKYSEYIKQGKETFPDGTVIDVLYYWKAI